MAGQPTPPSTLRNNGLIRPYEGKPIVNEPLIRPYFWGGSSGGGIWLTSHDKIREDTTQNKTRSLMKWGSRLLE